MIRIELDQQEVPLGGTISGEMSWTAHKALSPRKIDVMLRWHTEGRGSQADDDVTTGTFACGEVAENQEVRQRFEFQVPQDGPISFDGRLIRLIWSVRVNIDLPWARDPNEEASFRVSAPEVTA